MDFQGRCKDTALVWMAIPLYCLWCIAVNPETGKWAMPASSANDNRTMKAWKEWQIPGEHLSRGRLKVHSPATAWNSMIRHSWTTRPPQVPIREICSLEQLGALLGNRERGACVAPRSLNWARSRAHSHGPSPEIALINIDKRGREKYFKDNPLYAFIILKARGEWLYVTILS